MKHWLARLVRGRAARARRAASSPWEHTARRDTPPAQGTPAGDLARAVLEACF